MPTLESNRNLKTCEYCGGEFQPPARERKRAAARRVKSIGADGAITWEAVAAYRGYAQRFCNDRCRLYAWRRARAAKQVREAENTKERNP